MGLVECPWAICDEPGAWETNGGQLLHDAIETAKGKPGSPLRALHLGTLAPAESGWWHDLVDGGSHNTTYVQALRGDPEKWDQWQEIQTMQSVDGPYRLRFARSYCRNATRRGVIVGSRRGFLSYRLNIPSADEATMLLHVDDWQRVLDRPVPRREGRPIFAYDLGGGRAWSAAVVLWRNGRVEALAVAPGIPWH